MNTPVADGVGRPPSEDLSYRECIDLLATEQVGRLGVVVGSYPQITDHRADSVTERAESLGVEAWAGGDKPRLVRIIPTKVTGRRIPAHEIGWATDDRGYL